MDRQEKRDLDRWITRDQPEDDETWPQGHVEVLGKCVICGETVTTDNDPAEMHDAAMLANPEMYSEAEGGIVHANCGLGKGWVTS